MEELRRKLAEVLSDRLYQIIISNPRSKTDVLKIKVRPVMVKGEVCFQETLWKGPQVFHKNRTKEEMLENIAGYMEADFKQLEAQTMDGKMHVLVGKKGTVTIKEQKNKGGGPDGMPDMSHNRTKRYILEEGKPVPFLIDLGVQTKEGKIVHARYDKFKQINRYLEFVEDVLPVLNRQETVRIIDFGCGKSYLTFALYYYLHEMKGLDVSVTGLDLKEEVIENCNRLARKYGYGKLNFLQGDISAYNDAGEVVDMVVTLHACDTATDHAIKKAVDWNAKVIFTVPCCQHEVNRQIENEILSPVLRYGLLKERMAALVTDGIRACLLEEAGYDTQVLEFIDMEHTPKNILIRAVRRNGRGGEKDTKAGDMARFLNVETTLQRLMGQ
ncbi:SAM-dependent methyltransferase [Lachnospiraceae bacterium]|jgi:SAM-dependent methyltransferase|nr:SAM-dependent methyltransferase [Lachnospiraceae bacterium]